MIAWTGKATWITCPACGGSGNGAWDPKLRRYKTCPRCHGKKVVRA